MILLFTDFGPGGPYLGQMRAVLAEIAPATPVIDLMSDIPAFDARLGAYLLAAHAPSFPAESVFLAVVDPGVGSARPPLVVRAGNHWYVGPGNGLFALVLRRAAAAGLEAPRAWEIDWRPERLSATFHGRDLFAPVAARLALGEAPPGTELAAERLARLPGTDWPDDLARIVYVDRYGNATTGLRAETLAPGATLRAGGRTLNRARRFSELPPGAAFWYENANGLAEIAVNRGHAAHDLGLTPGTEVTVANVG
jgi:hypothetical protein